MKMIVVSSREFRANQRKYFDLALTNDVVITSRSHGSYRLVPVRESDTLIDQTTLEAKIRRGIEEYEQGKVHRMEEGLYIELHKRLFPPESDAYGDMNRFFEGVFRRAIPETIQGNTVYTLAPGDHLLYLICHAFKHFLHSGFGIRQVCDIVLYANAYGSEIDWMVVLDRCRELNADKFAAALFRIGSNYLVFDMEKAGYPDAWRQIQVDEIPMLEDLLSAGVYGGADMSRRHSSSITLDAVAAQKQGRKAKHAALTSAFPPASRLSGRYPYLKKAPWLLPAAWASRLLHYFKETRSTDNNNASASMRIGSERIELMKEYGILK